MGEDLHLTYEGYMPCTLSSDWLFAVVIGIVESNHHPALMNVKRLPIPPSWINMLARVLNFKRDS